MFGSTDPHRFRKTVAGSCMIGAPILFLLGSIVSPNADEDNVRLLANVAADADRFYASTMLVMAGWALFLVATLGIMHMLRERGAAFGHVGGALAIVGTLAAVAQSGVGLVVWQMPAGSRSQMVALMTRTFDTTGSAVAMFLVIGVTLGYLVLCWGLTNVRAVPMWMSGLIAASAVLYALGGFLYSRPLYVAASAALLAGMGALGWMVLGETAEEWEHTPEVGGLAHT